MIPIGITLNQVGIAAIPVRISTILIGFVQKRVGIQRKRI